jgi:hypothetical protein
MDAITSSLALLPRPRAFLQPTLAPSSSLALLLPLQSARAQVFATPALQKEKRPLAPAAQLPFASFSGHDSFC